MDQAQLEQFAKALAIDHQAKRGSAGNKELLTKLRQLLAKEKEREAQKIGSKAQVKGSKTEPKVKTDESQASGKVSPIGSTDKDDETSCAKNLKFFFLCVIIIVLTFSGLGVIIALNQPDAGKKD